MKIFSYAYALLFFSLIFRDFVHPIGYQKFNIIIDTKFLEFLDIIKNMFNQFIDLLIQTLEIILSIQFLIHVHLLQSIAEKFVPKIFHFQS
jgi:hypothetical protein